MKTARVEGAGLRGDGAHAEEETLNRLEIRRD